MAKRTHINVKYKSIPIAEVRVTGISRIGDIQDAIKRGLPKALAHVDYPQIQLYDTDNNPITTWAQFKSLSNLYFAENGSSLYIQATPPPSREGSRFFA